MAEDIPDTHKRVALYCPQDEKYYWDGSSWGWNCCEDLGSGWHPGAPPLNARLHQLEIPEGLIERENDW